MSNDSVVWRRSARALRSSLRIDPRSGQIVVTLPLSAGRAEGRALLMRHADWVATHIATLPDVPPVTEGESLPIGGVSHLIRRVPGRGVRLQGAVLRVGGNAAGLEGRVMRFLRQEGLRRLSLLALAKAGAAGLAFAGVRVRDTRSRWGSCSPDGVLMFSWRLVMAPAFVQDYVVAHEVAHLRFLDHGRAFWMLAQRLSPHRRAATDWLSQEGPRLLRIGRPST
jgi:predicted metal-dependent hydrolase